ncbi:hypothetical protein CA13_73550 [Planctomycetes bacterium CA13]|uniref:Uncharacterized protein n=1 Tax=Novipirellula herctigrandis TaxID=2527986 RepID=A0A5C5YLL5_9BACT|nr:hypothetical protein CA13_73550 [Planctomycetes bacterium CA13]
MLPTGIDSKVFGHLTLRESEFGIAGSVERSGTFESVLTAGDNKVRIVLNPDFDWPYPDGAEKQIRSLLNTAEQIHTKLQALGTDGIFKLHSSGIAQLGEYTGYDRWKASEEQLFANWVLESEIFFTDGFRLIYAGHPIYYLDLLLEFDCKFCPTHVQFDG